MNACFIDTHCHLQFSEYDRDRDELITRMRLEGIAAIIVGVDYASSVAAVAISERYENLFAAVALHPNHVLKETFDEKAFAKLASNPKVVAIGECGLDYFRMTEKDQDTQRMLQETLFRKHLALAQSLHMPLIIHARPTKGTMNAYHDLIALLTKAKKEYPQLRGDVHFFVGGLEEMRRLITIDFSVSFTAVITFARDYDNVIIAAPLSHVLAETDAPYIAPASRRGMRNDPLSIVTVVQRIALIRGEKYEIIRKSLVMNTLSRFDLVGITTS